MSEHVPSSLLETLSLEEERDVRLYILEELKSIIKKYALYCAPDKDCDSHEKEPTPHQFFGWIETLAEGGTLPSDERFDEQVLAHDVRRFEKLYRELANIALKKPIAKEMREEAGIFFIRETNERLRVFDEKVMTHMEKLVEEGVDKDYIAMGLAGVDSDRAWKFRERILKEGHEDAFAQSLSGDHVTFAWRLIAKANHRKK